MAGPGQWQIVNTYPTREVADDACQGMQRLEPDLRFAVTETAHQVDQPAPEPYAVACQVPFARSRPKAAADPLPPGSWGPG